MRRVCQQYRRWHHQLLLTANHLARRPHPQPRGLSAPHQCRAYARKPQDDDLVIREYEQQGADKKTRRRVRPEAELEAVKAYLKSKLDRLDQELAEMKEGPFGPNSEFMQSLSAEERKIALETMQKEGQTRHDDLGDLDTEELDRLIKDEEARTEEAELEQVHRILEPEVTLKPPRQHQAYVQAFNAAVKAALVGSASKTKTVGLWKCYQRCRARIPNFWSLVPTRAWDVLWRSQMELADNATHVRALAEDLLSQSLPLSPEQLMAYMKSLRSTGDLSAAIDCWNSNRGILGPNAEVARQFWTLGVQLYSEDDQPGEAQRIALECLDHASFADATILVPVVAAWARASPTDNLQKAWACYLRFKAELGDSIRAQDYETISSSLLQQGMPDMALTVFKDMLLDRAKSSQGHDSLSSFRKLLGKVEELQSSAINEHDVSKISLAALTVLPRFLQNKYFFASWIKNLIGRGEIEAAAQVVELMYERGVRPDAKHLNGIVGAWLREGRRGSAEKAEQMAWAMIDARIDFVRQRQLDREARGSGNKSTRREARDRIPLFIQRTIPAATIETFSILLLHYTRGCHESAARRLMESMTEKAMIAPNSFIYNHWMYAALRAHEIANVWTHYQNMKDNNVRPDLETFACLWDTAKLQFDRSKSAHSPHFFSSARALFKEMTDWTIATAQEKQTQLTNTNTEINIKPGPDFSHDLYDQIIRVFALSHDLRGILCALHGLAHLYDQHPDPVTSRIIVISISRLLPPDSKNGRAAGRQGTRRRIEGMRTAVSAVKTLLQIVTDQRAVTVMEGRESRQQVGDEQPAHERDGDEGEEGDELTGSKDGKDQTHPLDHLTNNPTAAKQFRLDVLSDLLVVALKRMMPVRGGTENATTTAAATAATTIAAAAAATATLANEVGMVARNMGLGRKVGFDVSRRVDFRREVV